MASKKAKPTRTLSPGRPWPKLKDSLAADKKSGAKTKPKPGKRS